MKHKLLYIVIVLSYTLILGHFCISNYIKVIGPHYTLPKNASHFPKLTPQDEINMVAYICPNETLTSPTGLNDTSKPKGFPFATNNTCGGGSSDFMLAKSLNAIYIVMITIVSGLFITQVYIDSKAKN